MSIDINDLKLDEIRERLVKALVDDFDSSPNLAEEAAARVTQDDVDDFDNIDELAEFVYDNEKFWEQ